VRTENRITLLNAWNLLHLWNRVSYIRNAIETYGADPQAKNKYGVPIFHVAAQNGALLELLRYYFTKDIDFTDDKSSKTKRNPHGRQRAFG
jgi:hypothetical protein